jgi:phytoene dehydrogenase-like protein
MSGAIMSRVKTPPLRDVLLRYATYNGSDPRVAPATLNCIAWVELGLGGYGVRGGIHRLAEALADTARSVGVEIVCGQRVERIAHEAGRTHGVWVDGALVRADIVVANADAFHVEQSLLGNAPLPPSARPAPSTSGHTVVVKASADAARSAHTVYFASPYAAEFADLFDHGRPPVTPTVYACDQALAHGRALWPDGASPVFLMANTPAVPADGKVPDDWESVEASLLERAVAAGVVRSSDPVVWRRGPGGLASTFPDTGGALYGAASNGMWSAFRRPANRHPRIAGLYLASGSAHPGGGVPLCALSGRRAALEADTDRRERAA